MPAARKPRHLHRDAWDVLRGRIVVGELVRLACERALRDHAGGARERGLDFRPDRARHVLEFFPLLRLWEGEWAGKPFTLQPWQGFVLSELFGWHRSDGRRRFNQAHVEHDLAGSREIHNEFMVALRSVVAHGTSTTGGRKRRRQSTPGRFAPARALSSWRTTTLPEIRLRAPRTATSRSRLAEAGKLLGITLMDSIVDPRSSLVSLREIGPELL